MIDIHARNCDYVCFTNNTEMISQNQRGLYIIGFYADVEFHTTKYKSRRSVYVYVCFLYVVDFFVNITLDRNRRFTSKSETGHNIKKIKYIF